MAKSLSFIGFRVFVAVCLVGSALADLEADQKACSDQLTSITSCFNYVQGKAKSPSTDCCTNLRTVRETAPKCLCILVKDSTDPSIGVAINQTLALELPSVCKVKANISDCPALLNISPNSPDAKIFGAANGSSPAPPASGGLSSSTPPAKDSNKSSSLVLKPQPSLSALAVLFVLLPLWVFDWVKVLSRFSFN